MRFITLDGRVGKNNAEVKTSKGGKQYLRFSLANNSFSNGTTKTTWYDVLCYKPEIINGIGPHLKTGSAVNLRGDIETTANVDGNGKVWVNNYIIADMIEFSNSTAKREKDSEEEAIISTYTGNTQVNTNTPQKQKEEPITTGMPKASKKQVEQAVNNGLFLEDTSDNDSDDLPF